MASSSQTGGGRHLPASSGSSPLCRGDLQRTLGVPFTHANAQDTHSARDHFYIRLNEASTYSLFLHKDTSVMETHDYIFFSENYFKVFYRKDSCH